MSAVSGALRAFTKRFRNQKPQHIPAAVIGVANDTDHLLQIINNPASPASDRVAAASQIRAMLEEEAVSSIQEIWYSARILLEAEGQTEVRRAGWRLMASCIDHDELNVGAFNVYYHTLIDFSNIEDFDLILNALNRLTQNGRRTVRGQSAAYRLPTVLVSWIQLLALRSQELRSNPAAADVAEQWGASTETNFQDFLVLVANFLKFNMSIFEERDLESLLLCATVIMRSTSSVKELELCVGLIDAVMAYGIIPLPLLQSVLEVLSGITLMVPALSDSTWRTIQNLCNSHLGNSTVVSLCRILQPESTDATGSMKQGAARVLARIIMWKAHEKDASEEHSLMPTSSASTQSSSRLPGAPSAAASAAEKALEDDDRTGLQDVPLALCLEAYASALEYTWSNLVLEIAKCLRDLLADPITLPFFDYDTWQSPHISPLRIIWLLSEFSKRPASDAVPNRPVWQARQSRFAAPRSAAAEAPANIEMNLVLTEIFGLLTTLLAEKAGSMPIEDVAMLCIELGQFLDDTSAIRLVNCCVAMHYCSAYMEGWYDRLTLILNNLYLRPDCSPDVQQRVLGMVRDIYLLESESDDHERFARITETVYSVISSVSDAVAATLLDLYKMQAPNSSWAQFDQITSLLMAEIPDQSSGRVTSDRQSRRNAQIARAMGEVFVRLFRFNARRGRLLYYSLVQVCRRSLHDVLPFQQAFALLTRLRANANNCIFLTEPAIEVDYGVLVHKHVPADYVKDCVNDPSLVLKRNRPLFSDDDGAQPLGSNEYSIDSSMLLSLLVEVVQSGAPEDIYCLVLVNLASILSNMQLFISSNGDLLNLRNIICSQLTSQKLPLELKTDDVSKQDVFSVLIHALTILLSYDEIFQKQDYDRVVQSLLLYMTRNWDSAANWAIHCLVLCCYECPSSVQRFLPQLLTKFQTKMTTKESATHILEFLLTLSMATTLTDNFNFAEYKRVFGMCFSYIQDANDSLTKSKTQADTNTSILSQYLLRLAYTSITYLFLSIELPDRRRYVSYLVRNLVLADGGGTTDMSPMSLVTYDMICRYTYSDLPLTLYSAVTALGKNDEEEVRRWLMGNVIFEYRTNRKTGNGRYIIRRSVGTVLFRFSPEIKVPAISNGMAINSHNAVYSANLSFMLSTPMSVAEHPVPLPIPDDPLFNRSIASLDRAPVLDVHKIGVIYIGPGQTNELDILANTSGSPAYRRFLERLGTLIRLKGNKDFYVGGLDTEMDMDGKYAYSNRGRIVQNIFHVTTMMPNRPGDDQFSAKKRHIGNNFVNIYFDESCQEFNFDVVKSQFNFINIVITPTHAKGKWRVRAYRKEGLDNVLAAYELKTVSEDKLSGFVVSLAMKASQYATVYNQHGEYTDNWMHRLQLIQQVYTRLQQRPKPADEEEEDEHPVKMLEWLDFTRYTIPEQD